MIWGRLSERRSAPVLAAVLSPVWMGADRGDTPSRVCQPMASQS